MSNLFLSANQLLSQSDSNSHKCNLFMAMLGSSDVIPLDGNGLFSLIKTQRYKQLLSTLQECQNLKQKLEEECHTLSITNAELKKELQIYESWLSQFKTNQANFENKVKSLTDQLRNSEQKRIDLEAQFKKMAFKATLPEQKTKTARLEQKNSTNSTPTQTIWFEQTSQMRAEDKPQCQESKQKDAEQMEEKLYTLLRSSAQKFEEEFKTRLKRLEECEMILNDWQKQKEQYRLQNERLKELAKARNVEDEKIKIWQESITSLVQRVEQSINEKPQQLIFQEKEQSSKKNQQWEKAVIERGRLAEFRLRIKEIDQKMRVEQQGEEEGPVVALVRLTQKVKSIVRELLIESQNPV